MHRQIQPRRHRQPGKHRRRAPSGPSKWLQGTSGKARTWCRGRSRKAGNHRAFGHHAAVLHDQRGERAAPAGANVLESQGNGAAHKICGHGFVSLFQGALPVANYKCSFFRMRGFEKSRPCPPQAACVANAATATSIKLSSSPRRPILRALLRTSSGGILSLALSQAYHRDVVTAVSFGKRGAIMSILESPNYLRLALPFALLSAGLAISPLAARAAQQPQPAPPPHDMDHMQHNHGGFMQEGMHHAVAKGIKLEQQVDLATHTITLREGPLTLPANTSHMKMPQPPDVFWTIPFDAFLLAYPAHRRRQRQRRTGHRAPSHRLLEHRPFRFS